MAVQTTTQTANIKCLTEDGGSYTIKLNDPIMSGADSITAAKVTSAMSHFFASTNDSGVNILCDASGNAITAVDSTKVETIVKTVEDIN